MDPFGEVPTLTMIGDVMIIDRPANRPFDQYPRNVAKRSIDYMKELGIADEMVVGPEYEFYVFDRVEYSTRPEASGFGWTPVKPSGARGNNGYQVPRKSRVPHHAAARCHPGSPEPDLHAVGGLGGSESSTTTLK